MSRNVTPRAPASTNSADSARAHPTFADASEEKEGAAQNLTSPAAVTTTAVGCPAASDARSHATETTAEPPAFRTWIMGSGRPFFVFVFFVFFVFFLSPTSASSSDSFSPSDSSLAASPASTASQGMTYTPPSAVPHRSRSSIGAGPNAIETIRPPSPSYHGSARSTGGLERGSRSSPSTPSICGAVSSARRSR